MTEDEVVRRMRDLQELFAVVRLVDLNTATQLRLDEEGRLRPQPHACFATWGRRQRCENCISAKATKCHGQGSRLELAGEHAYFALANYLEMDGHPYTMELVSFMNDDSLVDAFGREVMVKTISGYNQKLYVDSLTGAFNRRYFDDELQQLPGNVGLMVVDVDDFKTVNDTFGHKAGDAALKAVATAMRTCIRESDALVRYGGDEFLVLLFGAPYEVFGRKAEEVRQAVASLRLGECPGRRFSVSIGALYFENEAPMDIAGADRLLYQAKKTKDRALVARAGLRASA